MSFNNNTDANPIIQPNAIHALIVAAGKGSRFGADVPKQYLTLSDKTIIEHTVARLAASKYLNHCLLVIAANDTAAQALNFAMPVSFTTGGVERWQSVQAGVDYLLNAGAKKDDLVVIHDAARPAVPVADINKVIEAAISERYGAILACPVADTLKAQTPKLNDDGCFYISHTVDRQGLWQAQTPQVYRIGALKKVLSHVVTQKLTITDEASGFEVLNLPIRLITGSRQNIKLTYPEDFALLKLVIANMT